MSRPTPTLRREDCAHVTTVATRWSDNDMFGHLNNAVYYELFDTALDRWLTDGLGAPEATAEVYGVVAESACRFLREAGYPSPLEVGVRVVELGRASVTFELGMWVAGEEPLVGLGRWVQVYVDRASHRATSIPDATRTFFETARGG